MESWPLRPMQDVLTLCLMVVLWLWQDSWLYIWTRASDIPESRPQKWSQSTSGEEWLMQGRFRGEWWSLWTLESCWVISMAESGSLRWMMRISLTGSRKPSLRGQVLHFNKTSAWLRQWDSNSHWYWLQLLRTWWEWWQLLPRWWENTWIR